MSQEHHLQLDPRKSLFYRAVAIAIRGLAQIFFRPSVQGRTNIPLTGAVLVAPIHRSNLDFAFTLFISQRKVFFMAKDSLFKVPVLGSALISLGAFPVKRGSADREAMRSAEEVLTGGHALILFPEGTRKYGPHVEPLHDGAMFIAARSHATVVPVGIAGTDRALPDGAKFPRPVKVRVVVGEPIAPLVSDGRPSRSQITEKTEELRSSLEAVYRQSLGS
ncbi:MAG: 1-acyl-sn-glycerol-3-phosphate acyltransferase [Acidimicrobiaceae bacterium]|nr:1-acyl-sn-glycerol-3-phosphate acyltransferase [Acidimicrobiaceae bacterium]